MKPIYVLRYGWGMSIGFEHLKDATDMLVSLQRGMQLSSVYVPNVGSLNIKSPDSQPELSITVSRLYTQNEVNALQPKQEEENDETNN